MGQGQSHSPAPRCLASSVNKSSLDFVSTFLPACEFGTCALALWAVRGGALDGSLLVGLGSCMFSLEDSQCSSLSLMYAWKRFASSGIERHSLRHSELTRQALARSRVSR